MRVSGLPISEDIGIILRLFVLTQYRRVLDRQTDRQAEILQRGIAVRFKTRIIG